MNTMQEKLENNGIYKFGFSNGKKYVYKRILELIENDTIKDIESLKIGCLIGLEMENN